MTVELAGTWERGWLAPMTEIDLWWSVMRSYDVRILHMTPVSGLKHKMLQEHENWNTILSQDLTPVYVDELAECSLSDFAHPEKALYIFGKANGGPPRSQIVKRVRIDTPTLGMLWPHQAAAVILQDRNDNYISNR